MLGLYVLGFVAAVVTARVLKSSILKSGRTPFLLEMPSYRWPTVQSIGLRLLRPLEGVSAARRNGDPAGDGAAVDHDEHPVRARQASGAGEQPGGNHRAAPSSRPSGRWASTGRSGSACSRRWPRARPSSPRWGRFTAWIRKRRTTGCRRRIHDDLTPGGAFALLVFFAFAMQCISTIAVVRRETGGWKWPAAQFGYMSALAYAGAFVAAHVIR